ncbi:MAG: PP2C family protein-serine/threonine phosphatase [Desulforhopalus sp.]
MREQPLILIVEDNPANLDIMKTRLIANDYAVITAMDGEEGLQKAREIEPDLVLLDILMPKLDGLEVCRRLKADPLLPFIPIILVTAKASSKDIIAGLEAGGDEYLTKPVNHGALVARVKSMLRIKDLHDTVVEQSAQLKTQLKAATKIQTLFWPQLPKPNANCSIWGVSVPATYVGGDLYDIIPLTDGSHLCYIADVSGKGVPAALIMAALSTKFRAASHLYYDLNKLLQSVNLTMFELTFEEGSFATAILIRYWPDTGKLQFIRAGHPSPLWINGGTVQNLPQENNIALGVTPKIDFEMCEIVLAEGDSMLFYTDGVTDAENGTHELFGIERLEKFIEKASGPPRGKELLNEVNRWRGGAEVNDDLTLLEIWRK